MTVCRWSAWGSYSSRFDPPSIIRRKSTMHKSLVLSLLGALLGVLIGAFAYAQLSSEAGAAPPPPSTQPVREQNLDGSGLVRVHEAGTANVNVTNGAVPVTGTVTVENLPAEPFTKTFLLFDGSISPGETINTPFVDVRGCRDFTIFVLNGGQQDAEGTKLVFPRLLISPDGSSIHGGIGTQGEASMAAEATGQLNTAFRFTTDSAPVEAGTQGLVWSVGQIAKFTPFAAAGIQAPANLPARSIKVTLFCAS